MSLDVSELYDSARQVVGDIGIAANEQESWQLISKLGWLMVSTPENFDGLGMGLAGATALNLELGRGLSTVPFLPAMLSIDAVCHSTLTDRVEMVTSLMAGDSYIATSLLEPVIEVRYGRSVEHVFSGTVQALQSADRASQVLVWTSDREMLALIPLDHPGVSLVSRSTWDQTRRLFDLQLDDVIIREEMILAKGSSAKAITERLATLRDFGLAADAVGGASALLEMTVDYLQIREQYGRPLALFQALKHRCADLKASIEGAQALLLDGVARLADQLAEPVLSEEASSRGKAAKLLACSTYMTVAEEALQLHGGIGMTAEHQCHLFLKRAMLNEHLGRSYERYELDLAQSLLASA